MVYASMRTSYRVPHISAVKSFVGAVTLPLLLIPITIYALTIAGYEHLLYTRLKRKLNRDCEGAVSLTRPAS